jgi:hypothetical protein
MNETETCANSDENLTQPRSVFDLKTMRATLLTLRDAHGPESAIGYHCSNLVELLQLPELPRDLIRRQLKGLDRLRAGLQ